MYVTPPQPANVCCLLTHLIEVNLRVAMGSAVYVFLAVYRLFSLLTHVKSTSA